MVTQRSGARSPEESFTCPTSASYSNLPSRYGRQLAGIIGGQRPRLEFKPSLSDFPSAEAKFS
jgi:hypothetical protein